MSGVMDAVNVRRSAFCSGISLVGAVRLGGVFADQQALFDQRCQKPIPEPIGIAIHQFGQVCGGEVPAPAEFQDNAPSVFDGQSHHEKSWGRKEFELRKLLFGNLFELM